jgi:hypothetical protein
MNDYSILSTIPNIDYSIASPNNSTIFPSIPIIGAIFNNVSPSYTTSYGYGTFSNDGFNNGNVTYYFTSEPPKPLAGVGQNITYTYPLFSFPHNLGFAPYIDTYGSFDLILAFDPSVMFLDYFYWTINNVSLNCFLARVSSDVSGSGASSVSTYNFSGNNYAFSFFIYNLNLGFNVG